MKTTPATSCWRPTAPSGEPPAAVDPRRAGPLAAVPIFSVGGPWVVSPVRRDAGVVPRDGTTERELDAGRRRPADARADFFFDGPQVDMAPPPYQRGVRAPGASPRPAVAGGDQRPKPVGPA